MNSILKPRPDDRPPQREEWGTGVAISVAAHLALIAALVWGVHWHANDEPEGVTAELWAAVPQAAAPAPTSPAPAPEPTETPPPPPPPPAPAAPAPTPAPPPVADTPKPPDIVTERLEDKKRLQKQQQEQARLDKAKLAQQKADQLQADQKKAEAQKPPLPAQPKQDAKQLAKLHDDYMKRVLGQMDAPANSTANAAGTAARDAGPSASYAGRIKARIHPNIIFTGTVTGNPAAEVEVHCSPDGTIIGRRITQSSGVKEWDDAVLQAIDRTAILPRDTDGRVQSTMLITFRPND